jgi:hypothetical protein
MLQEPVIRRVTLSRYLFEFATQNVRSDQEVAPVRLVSIYWQDAVEICLVAAADHLNVHNRSNTPASANGRPTTLSVTTILVLRPIRKYQVTPK